MLTTGCAPINFMAGRSGISNLWCLLEQAETRAEKFLPVRERAIVNAQSLGEAGILFPIVRPALQSLLTGVPPLHRPSVIFSSLVAVLLKALPGTTRNISVFHNIVHLIKSISINIAYYW